MTDTVDRIAAAFGDAGSPSEITRAREWYESLVVGPFEYSSPATVFRQIDVRNLHNAGPADVEYKVPAYSIPAHVWSRPLTEQERGAEFVQLVDRRGSYLAAWGGCEMPDGGWFKGGPARFTGGPRATPLLPGYYLWNDIGMRGYLNSIGMPNPFVRHPLEEACDEWLTAPLAQLAIDLTDECGASVEFAETITTTPKCRPLDAIASRLASALKTLEASRDPIAPVVRKVVKDGYTRGTSWFEYGPKPGHPLYRPAWRHTILDRAVANTWRSLRKAQVRPFAFGAVDSALFAPPSWIPAPSENITNVAPMGLPMGTSLGAWRHKAFSRIPSGDFDPADLMREMISGRNDGE